MFFAFETGDKIPIPRWLIQKSDVLKMFSKYEPEIVYMDHIFSCYVCLQITESIADNRTAPLHTLQYIPLLFDYLRLKQLHLLFTLLLSLWTKATETTLYHSSTLYMYVITRDCFNIICKYFLYRFCQSTC